MSFLIFSHEEKVERLFQILRHSNSDLMKIEIPTHIWKIVAEFGVNRTIREFLIRKKFCFPCYYFFSGIEMDSFS